jgi:hypothetical protein
MALEEAIWMDDTGSFHDEEGEGRPFCLDCVAMVEERIYNEATRVRRIQERAGSIRRAPNAFGFTIFRPEPSIGAGETDVGVASGSDNMMGSRAEPSSRSEQPDPTPGTTVVERFVEAEQRFGIRIQGLNIRVDDEGDVRVLGEVVPLAGAEFTQDVIIVFMAYDANGLVMTVVFHHLQRSRAFAIEPLSLWLLTKAAPSRIRIFPRSP